jgi:hypothetical protein
MKAITLTFVALSAVLLVSASAEPAAADSFAIHVGGSGYDCDGGRSPYLYDAYYGSRFGSRFGSYGHYYPSYPSRGRHVWHDTSHWDYHPGGFVRHYDHYDYVPGHYDFHDEGHWDHRHW